MDVHISKLLRTLMSSVLVLRAFFDQIMKCIFHLKDIWGIRLFSLVCFG